MISYSLVASNSSIKQCFSWTLAFAFRLSLYLNGCLFSFGALLIGPNFAMRPWCVMRFESHNPKSLAMRKVFYPSDAKPLNLLWAHRKIAAKARKSCDVGLRCKKSAYFLRSSHAKCLRFGLPLRFGLRCEHPRYQIASDVGRAMRTTKVLLAWALACHNRAFKKKEVRCRIAIGAFPLGSELRLGNLGPKG